jgi:hypothetical protein
VLHFSIDLGRLGAVVARKAKGTRGGARDGSGRKALFQERASLTVHLERSAVRRLEEIAADRNQSAGAIVREAVSRYLARHRR